MKMNSCQTRESESTEASRADGTIFNIASLTQGLSVSLKFKRLEGPSWPLTSRHTCIVRMRPDGNYPPLRPDLFSQVTNQPSKCPPPRLNLRPIGRQESSGTSHLAYTLSPPPSHGPAPSETGMVARYFVLATDWLLFQPRLRLLPPPSPPLSYTGGRS